MTETTMHYDEANDTLFVTYIPERKTAAIGLNEYVVLHTDQEHGHVLGLTLSDYSLLINQTKHGNRYFPLTGLNKLPAELRDRVLDLLGSDPINDILSLSVYTPSLVDTVPIVSIKPVFPLDQPTWQSLFEQPEAPKEQEKSVSV